MKSHIWQLLAAPIVVLGLAQFVGFVGCSSSGPPAAGNGTATNGTGGNTTPETGTAATTGGADLEGTVEIDGSSTVYKLSQAVAEEFNKVSPKVSVTVKSSGTGGGFKRFVKGELAITGASRPIQEGEMKAAKEAGVEYIELPVAFDALTIAVNSKNDWVDSITVADLKKIWEPDSKITKWSDLKEGWPEEKISLHGAGTDSGTFEYFTEAIVGKKNASRSDYNAQENDNLIVQGIEGDKFSLGYLPYAYYEPRQTTLKALKIDWKSDDDKDAIGPSVETVVEGTYAPLSRPLFIYINRKNAEDPAIKSFVEFYLKNAKDLATDVKYIPLPDEAYGLSTARFEKMQTGTGFGGHSEFGLRIEEVMKREPKS